MKEGEGQFKAGKEVWRGEVGRGSAKEGVMGGGQGKS